MIKYALTPNCRRSYILGYFGDEESATCGSCDNCGAEGAPPRLDTTGPIEVDTAAGVEVLRKALSGVARAKGRFGKTTVAQMLTGSGSEKMARWGLEKLSTFGVLAEFKQSEVAQLLDALAAAGLVECQEVDRFRPIINLTEAGWSALKAQDTPPFRLTLPDDLARKVSPVAWNDAPRAPQSPAIARPDDDTTPADLDPADPPSPLESDPLWARLKALRTEWAREAKQPAYCIFSNQTLDALVRERPGTPHALGSIKGLGPARLERHGAALLEAISGHPAAKPVEPPRAIAPPLAVPDEPPPPADSVSTEEWTLRLLEKGFTPDEAAAIRGLEPVAILRHATVAARQGHFVPLASFLGPEMIDRWDARRREHGDAPPADGPQDALWSLFLACRDRER